MFRNKKCVLSSFYLICYLVFMFPEFVHFSGISNLFYFSNLSVLKSFYSRDS